MSEVLCGECQAPMKLIRSRYVNSKGEQGYFFGCSRFPACNGRHGADAKGNPLGIPADAETNKARTKAHEAFDAFRKQRQWKRSQGYIWLRDRLKIEKSDCSFAKFDKATCARVEEIVKQAQERQKAKAANA